MMHTQMTAFPQNNGKGRILHTRQAAQILNLSESEVRSMAQSGKLPGWKIGKLWSFWEKDIYDFAEGKSNEDPSD